MVRPICSTYQIGIITVACIGIFGQFQPTTAQHHRRHPSYSHPLASSKSDNTEWSNSVETNSSQSGTGPGLYNIVDYATYALTLQRENAARTKAKNIETIPPPSPQVESKARSLRVGSTAHSKRHHHHIKKRDTENVATADKPSEPTILSTTVDQITSDDNKLNNLVADQTCTKKLNLCSFLPHKMLQCVIHCSLNINALTNEPTRFLFRMLRLFISYPQYLCPTFGSIYNKIPAILEAGLEHNDLGGFLRALGFDLEAANFQDLEFIQTAPAALFNNLVKFGSGPAFDIVRPILITAEDAVNLELSEQNLFPQTYSNPACKFSPDHGWFVSMIDAMAKHPVTSDIFLRGFWVLSRGITQSLPYPVDGFFVSLLHAMTLLVGVDCSLVSFGEHGKSFVCLQPPPVDQVFEAYAKQEADSDLNNPYKWLVCGAHQVEIPGWTQPGQMAGRTDAEDVKAPAPPPEEIEAIDVNAFPNPEEDQTADY